MPRGVYPRKNSLMSEEVKAWIHETASEEIKLKDLAQMAAEHFNKPIKYGNVKHLVYRDGLPFKRNTRHNILLTDEQAEHMREIIPGRSSKEIAQMMNERYSLQMTAEQVRAWKKNHKVSSGYDTRYRPGRSSWNSGRKFPGRTNSGCFTDGHEAENSLPIGSIRKHGGYWVKKTTNFAKNDNWEYLHRLIWEEANGPVPDDCIVIFLDGNKDNLDLENLMCVTRAAACIANNKYGTVKGEPELNRAILQVSQLRRTINEKKE